MVSTLDLLRACDLVWGVLCEFMVCCRSPRALRFWDSKSRKIRCLPHWTNFGNFEKFEPGFTCLTSQKIRNLVKFGQILTEIENNGTTALASASMVGGLLVPHLSDVVDALSH
jgi:hypothetical protein